MTNDRIDIHNYGQKLERELARLARDDRILPEHRSAIARFVADARAGRTIKRGSRKRVSDGRCLKYLYSLRRFALEQTVPFEKVDVADMERFIFGIEDGTVKKLVATGGTDQYSSDSVLDYKKLLRKFYRWLLGEDVKRFHDLTGWFDTRETEPELKTFGLEQVKQMALAMNSVQGRALIMTLFDGGFRPTELFNVRLSDLTFRADAEQQLTAYVRIRHSKTKPRTISLPLATEELRMWVQRHPNGGMIGHDGRLMAKEATATLLTWSYHRCRNVVREVGKSELGERVYLYRFRHASATFYARHLTEYQMCARYGWVMGSAAVRRYVDQSGVLAADTASVIRRSLAEPAMQPAPSPSIRPAI